MISCRIIVIVRAKKQRKWDQLALLVVCFAIISTCMANDDFYPSFWCKMNLCIDLIFVIFDNLKIWRDDWRTDAVNYGYKTDRDISYTRKLHLHFAIQYIQYIMS